MDYHPKELELMKVSCGKRISTSSNVYWKVEEYWWAEYKPEQVDLDAKMWRDRGFIACSRFTVVESGSSWNNGQIDVRLYSLFVGVPKKELDEWYLEQMNESLRLMIMELEEE